MIGLVFGMDVLTPEAEPIMSDELKEIDPTDMSVYYAMGEYYPPNSVDTLNINWQGGRVEIVAYNGTDYFVEEASTRQLMEDERLTYNLEGETFGLFFTEDPQKIIDDAYKKVEIRIPQDKAKAMKGISINTNGEVVLKNISADKITINGKSGNVYCENTYSGATTVTTTSGKVNIAVKPEVGYSVSFSSKEGKLDSYVNNGLNSYVSGDGTFPYVVKTKTGDLGVSLFQDE